MLGVLDDLRTGLSPEGVVGGEFRLGISPYLSEVGIATVVDRLRGDFPDLLLRITTGWPEPLLEQLRRSEIDRRRVLPSRGNESADRDRSGRPRHPAAVRCRRSIRWICRLLRCCETSHRFPGSSIRMAAASAA
ncbi:MAG: hypothetical protein WDN24_07875 [Sphingomonas sp.]